jgi:hypothetical protein
MRKQQKDASKWFERRESKLYWSPRIELDAKETTIEEADETDWFVVVDEITSGVARLEIAPWPEVDVGGHLRFEEIFEISVPLLELQRHANLSRDEAGQPAPHREIRIGDTFRIRNLSMPGEGIVGGQFHGPILDVTRAARKQAKIAMYGAVTQPIDREEANRRRSASKDGCRFARPPRVSPEAGASLADTEQSAVEE